MNRKTVIIIVIALLGLCVIAGIIATVAVNILGTEIENLTSRAQCPHIVFFDDINGNGSHDTGELLFEDPSSGITLYDSNNQKVGDDGLFGCFLPANASGTMTMVVNMPKGYKATTPIRHTFETIFSAETVIYIGAQNVP
jgi:hypothetical protein